MFDFDTEAVHKIFSPSVRRPPLPSPDAAPAWVLLEPVAYIADHTNDTTAEASSSTGHTVRVTVCVTDPLGVSHVCVHCPGLKDSDFCNRPTVACSEKDFLILSVVFIFGPYAKQGLLEYFIYKAGPGGPALRLLPGPYPRGLTGSDIALMPRDDGAHFVLAALHYAFDGPWAYDLHIFSSRTWAWSRKVAQAEISSEVRSGVSIITPSKVIQLGGGTVGWVDLWKGIAVCNMLDEMPVLRFIPLPQLMPGHMEGSKSSWQVRNVSCSNGLIKFVEIEKHERHHPHERSLDDMDTLYDSDCLPKPKVIGWRAMTWYRMISWDHWRKGSMAYDKEISVDCQRHSMLFSEPTDNNAGELTLKNLLASFPVLSLTCDCDDIVYMLCVTKSEDKASWLISVDLKKKILVELAPFSLQGYFASAQPSELSNYLNRAPGTYTNACL
ncbi:hypothetical protein ACQ4PT_046408 [Festuca glaucescens]